MSEGSEATRIALVAGARPNFMKAAPVLAALRGYPRFAVELVHTGQHYDRLMSDAFFADLGLPEPDVQLGVGSGSHAEQTGRVMVAFEGYLEARRPDLVIVIGDVNSTLGCSVVAAKARTALAHVEAGLRSFDRSMPEEINRIVTDALSGICFTTSADADEHLRDEGHPPGEIHLVGNTMIDTLERFRHRSSNPAVPRSAGVEPAGYLLVTLHRPANVDDPATLRGILGALAGLPLPVVFPVHPRTRSAAAAAGAEHLLDRLHVLPPQGYLDFLALQAQAAAVLTDSGGIQEETTVLGVPCLTFRDNTERPITISHGTNRLIGTRPESIGPAVAAVLGEERPAARVPPLWDGHAGERIAAVLDRLF